MTSKRKGVDEISGRARKIPAHVVGVCINYSSRSLSSRSLSSRSQTLTFYQTPTRDPQGTLAEGIEPDPYSNNPCHEGTPQRTKASTYSEYTVGWICALPEPELVAAYAMLDEEHPLLPAAGGDKNVYLLGKIGPHNVVIACLPDESTGKASAATVAKDMLRSFEGLRFGLLVGVGGGAPHLGTSGNGKVVGEGSDEEDSEDDESGEIRDIRLGDVVISLHSKSSEAVVQYDFGKSVQGGEFFRTGTLNKPPDILRSAVGTLKAHHALKGHRLSDHLSKISANQRLAAAKFQYQGASKDRLFKPGFAHPEGRKSCKDCCGAHNVNLVKRKERPDTSPVLHYGTIGSADQVMKDSTLRDKWAKKENIICFEMEAAGKLNTPCLKV